ncbi:hypothetical protein CERSUDRAFT_125859 [Gelatoporia subvermispora B]|uniref:Spherulation-specific family 4 n=1 Tax=Ceriporiopsis subvermispora (strain B) TaxID=914234 RepID=M2R3R5_CERS8|nr:hypothetical protein CERSUDRAFT_125859 [Gelatoporia subvermispora B]
MYLARALSVATSGILLPLYVFPAISGDSGACPAWTNAFNAISNNPSLPFYVIVNPDSGPGAAGSQPDTSYQDCVPLLKAANVKLLGYVDTARTNRVSSAIEADVSTYAGWESTYSMDGIFFDDVSGLEGDLSMYETWSNFAKDSINGGDGFVTLNPGDYPTSGYFSIADFIVVVETFYDDFSTDDIVISSTEPASQQIVILHDGPSSVPTAVVAELVGTDHLAAIYITSSPDYTSIDSDLSTLAATVAFDG